MCAAGAERPVRAFLAKLYHTLKVVSALGNAGETSTGDQERFDAAQSPFRRYAHTREDTIGTWEPVQAL